MVGAQNSMYESITLKWVPVHPVVAPITTTSIEHTDDLNDTVQATSKTGCMGVMLQDSKESIHYLQLLCNFRKAAGFKDSPHSKKIPLIVKHIGDYHSILKRELGNLIKNYTGTLRELSFLRDPTDLQDFFVDKDLPFKPTRIHKNSNIERDLLMLPIGTSRVLSMSQFIHPLYQLQQSGYLCRDQMVELCFICCFLNTPVLFSECISQLSKNDLMSMEHPYYTWYSKTVKLFGVWQGGIEPRFSSCSDNFVSVFGQQRTLDAESRLDYTVKVLSEWIEYVDELHGNFSSDNVDPLDLLTNMESVCKRIKNGESKPNTALDFSMFRLSIFTTMAMALSLFEPGPHLLQITFPCKGTAAQNHLLFPDCNSTDKAEMTTFDCDKLMKGVSEAMGWKPYNRSRVEIHLCESFPGRALQKKDVFRLSQSIFDVSYDGIPVFKPFGYHGPWIPCRRPTYVNLRESQ
jgi:hypothetical protein